MRPAAELLEAAAQWYVALREADADDPARLAWRRWLDADVRHRQAWARMLALQEQLGSVPGDLLLPTLRDARRRWPFALRAAVCMGTPVLAGWAAGNTTAGLMGTIGAFTSLYGSGRPYLNRALHLAVIAVALALGVALGIQAAVVAWAGVVTVALIAMAATLLCDALAVGPPGAYMFTLACAAGIASRRTPLRSRCTATTNAPSAVVPPPATLRNPGSKASTARMSPAALAPTSSRRRLRGISRSPSAVVASRRAPRA